LIHFYKRQVYKSYIKLRKKNFFGILTR